MDASREDQARIEARVAPLMARSKEQAGRQPSRSEALELLWKHIESPALRAHMLAVEAAMAAYARLFGEDETPYRLAGLLHDFDYEKHPDPLEHPMAGCEILLSLGYPGWLVEAILGHATYTGVERTSRLAKVLFAVDELTGFLTAVAYVRPQGLDGMTWKSFKKKFKTPSFAAGVSRQEVEQGAAELGVDLPEHVLFVASALIQWCPEFPHVHQAEAAAPGGG